MSVDLKPKEHGAYAILAFPIVSGLAITGGTLVGALVAVTSLAGFFAHEPLLVAWGHRGPRAKRETPEAAPRAIILMAIGALCGIVAMGMGAFNVRMALVACLLLAAASFVIALRGKHRTLGGQLFGMLALSVPCVPILLAGEIPVLSTSLNLGGLVAGVHLNDHRGSRCDCSSETSIPSAALVDPRGHHGDGHDLRFDGNLMATCHRSHGRHELGPDVLATPRQASQESGLVLGVGHGRHRHRCGAALPGPHDLKLAQHHWVHKPAKTGRWPTLLTKALKRFNLPDCWGTSSKRLIHGMPSQVAKLVPSRTQVLPFALRI